MLIDTLASVKVLCFSNCENRVIMIVSRLLIDEMMIEHRNDSPYSLYIVRECQPSLSAGELASSMFSSSS